MGCGGATRAGSMVRPRPFMAGGSAGGEWQTPLVRVQPRARRLRPDHGRRCCRKRRAQEDHDRCDLSEGTSHVLKPGGQAAWRGREIGRIQGGMTTKSHALADATGRPIGFSMSAGQIGDYRRFGSAVHPADGGVVARRKGL